MLEQNSIDTKEQAEGCITSLFSAGRRHSLGLCVCIDEGRAPGDVHQSAKCRQKGLQGVSITLGGRQAHIHLGVSKSRNSCRAHETGGAGKYKAGRNEALVHENQALVYERED